MEKWEAQYTDEWVDAIEEGRIVRVPEYYAKIEGLPILRKSIKPEESSKAPIEKPIKLKKREESRIGIDELRRPLNWKGNQVISELLSNFYWLIIKRRRELGLSRRQLANSIEESENSIKLIENGILPSQDFVIVNKIQKRLGINLRKDNQDFNQSARSLINKDKEQELKKDSPEVNLRDEDIEILDD